MWFGFFYALGYLFWTMIYFAWRGHWIYGFLDWSKPVQHFPSFHSALALFASYECGISSADNYSTHGSAAGVACLLHWDTSALGRVLCLLGSGLPQLSALSE